MPVSGRFIKTTSICQSLCQLDPQTFSSQQSFENKRSPGRSAAFGVTGLLCLHTDTRNRPDTPPNRLPQPCSAVLFFCSIRPVPEQGFPTNRYRPQPTRLLPWAFSGFLPIPTMPGGHSMPPAILSNRPKQTCSLPNTSFPPGRPPSRPSHPHPLNSRVLNLFTNFAHS